MPIIKNIPIRSTTFSRLPTRYTSLFRSPRIAWSPFMEKWTLAVRIEKTAIGKHAKPPVKPWKEKLTTDLEAARETMEFKKIRNPKNQWKKKLEFLAVYEYWILFWTSKDVIRKNEDYNRTEVVTYNYFSWRFVKLFQPSFKLMLTV